jgi:flagellar protein FliS
MSNPYSNYRKTQVITSSKEKILLMLYEGAIRFTKHAHKDLLEGNIASKGKYVSKSTAILSELMATLDFEAAGDLARDLESLYVFMIDKLIEGNIKNDAECFVVVENLLRTLYDAWKDVIENPRPDGVPSKKLQPEEYQAWLEKNGDQHAAQSKQSSEKGKEKLKMMA